MQPLPTRASTGDKTNTSTDRRRPMKHWRPPIMQKQFDYTLQYAYTS